MASNFFRKFVLKFFIEIIIEIIMKIIERRENGMAINSFRKFVLKFFIEIIETDMANNSFRKFVLKFLVENRGKLENGNEKIVRRNGTEKLGRNTRLSHSVASVFEPRLIPTAGIWCNW